MRYSYDISTKDKEISYANLVDRCLLELGFGFNKNGTKYLRDLILSAFFMEDYKLEINSVVTHFLDINSINITRKNYIRTIQYSIENIDYKKAKENFSKIFNVEYDFYYLTPRNLTILFMNKLSKTEF